MYGEQDGDGSPSLTPQEQIAKTAHDYELVPLKETVVNIDYRHTGIGSNSCGPRLEEKYRLDEKKIRFAFSVQPDREV